MHFVELVYHNGDIISHFYPYFYPNLSVFEIDYNIFGCWLSKTKVTVPLQNARRLPNKAIETS